MGTLREVDPAAMRFTQDSIGREFQDRFFGIREAVRKISSGSMKAGDFPIIRANMHGGIMWSLDNRRLWVFRVSRCEQILVRIEEEEHPRMTAVLADRSIYNTFKAENFFPRVRGPSDLIFDIHFPLPVVESRLPSPEPISDSDSGLSSPEPISDIDSRPSSPERVFEVNSEHFPPLAKPEVAQHATWLLSHQEELSTMLLRIRERKRERMQMYHVANVQEDAYGMIDDGQQASEIDALHESGENVSEIEEKQVSQLLQQGEEKSTAEIQVNQQDEENASEEVEVIQQDEENPPEEIQANQQDASWKDTQLTIAVAAFTKLCFGMAIILVMFEPIVEAFHRQTRKASLTVREVIFALALIWQTLKTTWMAIWKVTGALATMVKVCIVTTSICHALSAVSAAADRIKESSTRNEDLQEVTQQPSATPL